MRKEGFQNIAVAFTEYQLLQIQALVHHYNISDIHLITLDNNRIPDWLIDQDMFVSVLVLPGINRVRWKRLTKSFIDSYAQRVRNYLREKRIDIFIGAQDENTLFALIKNIANPLSYWNIEDGFANYYSRNFSFRAGIWIKKQLFKNIYGYYLPIAYAHGQTTSDKSFRMLPKLSTGSDNNIYLGRIVKEYLQGKSAYLKDELTYLKKYNKMSTLVITDLKHFDKGSREFLETEVYKFHPKDHIDESFSINYISEKIPIEVIPFLLKKLKTVRFEVMSSSIINLLAMQIDLEIEIAFRANSKKTCKVVSYVSKNFSDKVRLSNGYR